MKQGNGQEHETYRWECSVFVFPCICSCCLPSCAFSYTFLFICKHAEVISALLRCCNNVANCLAFQWSIFDPGSSKQQWLTKAVNFFLSLILCEPCWRNLPCCSKWLMGWDFTDSSSQGLTGSSSIPPFLLSAQCFRNHRPYCSCATKLSVHQTQVVTGFFFNHFSCSFFALLFLCKLKPIWICDRHLGRPPFPFAQCPSDAQAQLNFILTCLFSVSGSLGGALTQQFSSFLCYFVKYKKKNHHQKKKTTKSGVEILLFYLMKLITSKKCFFISGLWYCSLKQMSYPQR